MDRAADRHLCFDVDVLNFAVVIDTAMDTNGLGLETFQTIIVWSTRPLHSTSRTAHAVKVLCGRLEKWAMDWATDRHLGLEVDVLNFAVVIAIAMDGNGSGLEALQTLVFGSSFVSQFTSWAT